MPQLTTSAANPVTAAYASGYLEKLSALLKQLEPRSIEAVGALLHRARAEGRQVFLLGNGGSAALASHIAVDLGKGCSRGRAKRFRVLALTDNTPWLTALANDLSYDEVFSEQLACHAQAGDVVIAISGSGNSKNVLKALELANRTIYTWNVERERDPATLERAGTAAIPARTSSPAASARSRARSAAASRSCCAAPRSTTSSTSTSRSRAAR